MSQQNARLVERAIAAINARDIEGYLACCTENVKLETPMAAVGGVYEGIDGIRRYFTDIEDAAPDFRIELTAWKRSIASGCSRSCASAPRAEPAAFAWHRRLSPTCTT